jgi:hypothetical protein
MRRSSSVILLVCIGVNAGVWLATGDWLSGLIACAIAIMWCALAVMYASGTNRVVKPAAEPEPEPCNCRCDFMGVGTPEHPASPLCRSLRPDADRDAS